MSTMARFFLRRARWTSGPDPRFCVAAASAAASGVALVSKGLLVKCEGHGEGHGHEHGHEHGDMPKKFRHAHASITQNDHMLFAIPKKGRLYEKVKIMLEGAGIEYKRKDRIDIAHSSNLPLSIVFLPAADIATYVGEGDVDLGITGEDCVAESNVEVDVLMQLGFGKCNLSVQAPKDEKRSVQSLAGKRIVTSFPVISQKFFGKFEQVGRPTQIKCINGSVEAACGLGLADGIVDLVETGTTMRAAGLEEVAVVMKSQAVLIANPHSKHPELVEVVRRRLSGWLTAQSWLMVTYNVERIKLATCEKITPGKRSPSIQPLEDPNYVAVSALIPKKQAAAIMDDLEQAGATDILLNDVLIYRSGDPSEEAGTPLNG